MKHLINKLSGADMWVADNRVDAYLAAGHRLAAASDAVKPTEEKPEEVEEIKEVEAPKRATRRKR